MRFRDYLIVLCVAFVLTACKTVVPTAVYRDSVRTEYRLDSVFVYQHDSIFRDRWRSGDTVYVKLEKWCTRWKDKIIVQHDTISITHQDTIVQEVKYVPSYYKGCSVALWIIVALVLLYIVWRVIKAIYLKK